DHAPALLNDVAFEDVALYFTREEWELLSQPEKQLLWLPCATLSLSGGTCQPLSGQPLLEENSGLQSLGISLVSLVYLHYLPQSGHIGGGSKQPMSTNLFQESQPDVEGSNSASGPDSS
uniref:KRAB domain-containing protein n=1 Tax=Chrysemys picta bellii TaxID=8478 RepID=A0A8C3PBX9_CHRPI